MSEAAKAANRAYALAVIAKMEKEIADLRERYIG